MNTTYAVRCHCDALDMCETCHAKKVEAHTARLAARVAAVEAAKAEQVAVVVPTPRASLLARLTRA